MHQAIEPPFQSHDSTNDPPMGASMVVQTETHSHFMHRLAAGSRRHTRSRK